MREYRYSLLLLLTMVATLLPAQQNTARVSGTVTDTGNAVLRGARVELQQSAHVVASVATDGQGQFTIQVVTPGTYEVVVSYVGFSPFQTGVTVEAGQVASVNAVLKVATESESVLVTAERAHGEAEAINEEKNADNILDVLPEQVITSLPNANVADAVAYRESRWSATRARASTSRSAAPSRVLPTLPLMGSRSLHQKEEYAR